MSEEEKILKTIRYCANDYMKQEDGIQCFEWGELWVLNEYIKELQQENKQLKERITYLENSNNRREETIISLRHEQQLDKYKEVIEEVREYIENYGHGYDCTGDGYYCLDQDNQKELLQILDKVKEDVWN